MTELIITADDYGYRPAYDEGILEAARAGAVDAVSALVRRPGLDPAPLLATGVEVGLHLELDAPWDAPRAGPADRERAAAQIREQLETFSRRFGRPPAYLDGHHHAHAREGLGVAVCDIANERALPVRSISARHRRLLRCRGVATPDLLLGRTEQSGPALPHELSDAGAGELPAEGVVEWMVHPGRRDPDSGSAYDAGREQDLALLLDWQPPATVRRSSHAGASLAPSAC